MSRRGAKDRLTLFQSRVIHPRVDADLANRLTDTVLPACV